MSVICCGHFNFILRDHWILCQDCEAGILAESPKGRRLLERKSGRPLMSPQQQAIHESLVRSYHQLVEAAGTAQAEALADYANNPGTN